MRFCTASHLVDGLPMPAECGLGSSGMQGAFWTRGTTAQTCGARTAGATAGILTCTHSKGASPPKMVRAAVNIVCMPLSACGLTCDPVGSPLPHRCLIASSVSTILLEMLYYTVPHWPLRLTAHK
jgi:hypothetical protein